MNKLIIIIFVATLYCSTHAMEKSDNSKRWLASSNHQEPAFEVSPELFRNMDDSEYYNQSSIGLTADKPRYLGVHKELDYQDIIKFLQRPDAAYFKDINHNESQQSLEELIKYMMITVDGKLEQSTRNIVEALLLTGREIPYYLQRIAYAQAFDNALTYYNNDRTDCMWSLGMYNALYAWSTLFFKLHRAQHYQLTPSFKRVFFPSWHTTKHTPTQVQYVHRALEIYRKKKGFHPASLADCKVSNSQGDVIDHTLCLAEPGSNYLLFSTAAYQGKIAELHHTLPGHITAFALNPAGTVIVSTNSAGELKIWSRESSTARMWKLYTTRVDYVCSKIFFSDDYYHLVILLGIQHASRKTYSMLWNVYHNEKRHECFIDTTNPIVMAFVSHNFSQLLDENNSLYSIRHAHNGRDPVQHCNIGLSDNSALLFNRPLMILGYCGYFILQGPPYVLHCNYLGTINLEHILGPDLLVPIGHDGNKLIVMDNQRNYLSLDIDKLSEILEASRSLTISQSVALEMFTRTLDLQNASPELVNNPKFLEAVSINNILKLLASYAA